MSADLSGRVALVTGGSSDIGAAICASLAEAGAQVHLTYFSDHEGAERTRAALGDDAMVFRANFADAASLTTMLGEVIEALPRIDILISNAASGTVRPSSEIKKRHWDWTMDVNARALLEITGVLVEAERLGRGARVVALSSLGAVRAIPQYTALGASKAALEATVRHLGLELGPLGIAVNAVAPGLVETRALAHFPNRAQLLDAAQRRTPLGRLTTPDDVAKVVRFLASPDAEMITGQTVTVDGGYAVVA